MKRQMQDLSRSIRDRLLNLAKARNEEFQNFLMRYALERWLYRLSSQNAVIFYRKVVNSYA